MPLTDAQCRNAACPAGKTRERFSDSGGLYLEVSPNGSRRWFWKYRHAGKEGRLALGGYPAVTLTAARKARDAAKREKDQGRDPVQVRKVEKLKAIVSDADTFKAIADEWYAKHAGNWSGHYAIRERRNLDKDLIPFLGERRLADVQPFELLAVLRRVEERGALDGGPSGAGHGARGLALRRRHRPRTARHHDRSEGARSPRTARRTSPR